MRFSVFLAFAALLSTPVVSVSAQQAPAQPATSSQGLPILSGTRVRVKGTTLVAPLIATYLEMKGDTVVFIESAGRGLWSLALDQITSVERSAGEKRRNTAYIARGALIGAPVGSLAFWGLSGIIDPSDSTRRFSRGNSAALGAVVGAAVGALVGTRFATEHWTLVPIPRRVSIVPQRNGAFRVGFGFNF